MSARSPSPMNTYAKRIGPDLYEYGYVIENRYGLSEPTEQFVKVGEGTYMRAFYYVWQIG